METVETVRNESLCACNSIVTSLSDCSNLLSGLPSYPNKPPSNPYKTIAPVYTAPPSIQPTMSCLGNFPELPRLRAHSTKMHFSKIDLDGHDFPPSPAPSSPRNGRRYAFATELVYTEGNDQYNASSTPIYQVQDLSTCRFLRLDALAGLICTARFYSAR